MSIVRFPKKMTCGRQATRINCPSCNTSVDGFERVLARAPTTEHKLVPCGCDISLEFIESFLAAMGRKGGGEDAINAVASKTIAGLYARRDAVLEQIRIAESSRSPHSLNSKVDHLTAGIRSQVKFMMDQAAANPKETSDSSEYGVSPLMSNAVKALRKQQLIEDAAAKTALDNLTPFRNISFRNISPDKAKPVQRVSMDIDMSNRQLVEAPNPPKGSKADLQQLIDSHNAGLLDTAMLIERGGSMFGVNFTVTHENGQVQGVSHPGGSGPTKREQRDLQERRRRSMINLEPGDPVGVNAEGLAVPATDADDMVAGVRAINGVQPVLNGDIRAGGLSSEDFARISRMIGSGEAVMGSDGYTTIVPTSSARARGMLNALDEPLDAANASRASAAAGFPGAPMAEDDRTATLSWITWIMWQKPNVQTCSRAENVMAESIFSAVRIAVQNGEAPKHENSRQFIGKLNQLRNRYPGANIPLLDALFMPTGSSPLPLPSVLGTPIEDNELMDKNVPMPPSKKELQAGFLDKVAKKKRRRLVDLKEDEDA